MKRWMHKLEVLVDKLILPCLGILLVVIVMELGFEHFVHDHHLEIYLQLADYFVILVFIFDLIFKYIRVRNIPKFIRKYWIDILAVFPFFLLFRGVEAIMGAFGTAISESAQTAQAVIHEGLEVEKEGSKVAKEATKLTRSHKFLRFLRPILRLPRFAKAIPKMIHFFEKPTGNHHWYEFGKK